MGHKQQRKSKIASELRRQRKETFNNDTPSESATKIPGNFAVAASGEPNVPAKSSKQVSSARQPVTVASVNNMVHPRVDKNKNNSYGETKTEFAKGKVGAKKTKAVDPKNMTQINVAANGQVSDVILAGGDDIIDEHAQNLLNEGQRNPDTELSIDVCDVIGDVMRMKQYFLLDPVTGKSPVSPCACRRTDGFTAIQIAIKNKAPAAVKFLLENGADVSQLNQDGDNAIMVAIKEGDASVINRLWPYRNSLDVNQANNTGYTALHLATEKKWEGCVNFLLQNGANPNSKAETGMTPLMLAAGAGDVKLVDRLIKAGADILILDTAYDTCISKAWLEGKDDTVDFILKNLPDSKKEDYIEIIFGETDRPNYMHDILELRIFPQLRPCTSQPSFRDTFYIRQLVHRITREMEDQVQSFEITMQASQLIFCIFFRFKPDGIDTGFVNQFYECKGPELIIRMAKHYTEVWKISERESILAFLPMIGLSEIPEGRYWLQQNYMLVSEYLNFFDRESLKVYMAPSRGYHWCLEAHVFPTINAVWKHFFDVVKVYETEQKERNIMELLEEEEREKMKKLKKIEKKKNKQHLQKPESKVHQPSDFETVFGEPLLESESQVIRTTGATTDLQMIAEMFRSNSPPACTNENAATDFGRTHLHGNEQKIETSACPTSINQQLNFEIRSTDQMSIPEVLPISTVKTSQDDWTKVQNKKQMHKEKDQSKTEKQHISAPSTPVKVAVTPKRTRKRNGKTQRQVPVPTIQEKPTTQVASNIGSARWADVAKAPIQQYPDMTDSPPLATSTPQKNTAAQGNTLTKNEFPSLDLATELMPETLPKQSRPTKMTFHFYDVPIHEQQPEEGVDIEFIGDMVENELQTFENNQANIQDNVIRDFSGTPKSNKQLSVECFMYDPEYVEPDTPSDGLMMQSDTEQLTTKSPGKKSSPKQLTQSRISSSPYQDDKWQKRLSTEDSETMSEDVQANLTEMTKPLAAAGENSELIMLARNQNESFDSFLKFACEERDNDPFISLHPSPVEQYASDNHTNAIDALFETPGEIPQWFEDDIDNIDEESWVDTNVGNVKQVSSIVNVEKSHVKDLAASDPAIISYQNNIAQAMPNHDVQKKRQQMERDAFTNAHNIHAFSARQSDKIISENDSGSAPVGNTRTAPPAGEIKVVTPVKQHKEPTVPVTNSAFGQKLLENACRLNSSEEKEIVLYPRDLDGVPFGNNNNGNSRSPNADMSFPSFHESTRLSSDFNKNDISSAHIMQRIQREQLNLFYRQYQKEIMTNVSTYQDTFIRNAQMAGVSHQEIQHYLSGQLNLADSSTLQGKMQRVARDPNQCPLPYQGSSTGHLPDSKPQRPIVTNQLMFLGNRMAPNGQYSFATQSAKNPTQPLPNTSAVPNPLMFHPQAVYQQYPAQMPPQNLAQTNPTTPQCQPNQPLFYLNVPPPSSYLQRQGGHSQTQHLQPARQMQQVNQIPQLTKESSMERTGVALGMPSNYSDIVSPAQSVQTSTQPESLPPKPQQIPPPVNTTPNMNSTNIRVIQAAQARMCASVRSQIEEINKSMLEAKIKSVRWRKELARLHTLPKERLLVLGKIVVPRDEIDRVYVAYHSTGPTILGYLTDGVEVAVKIIDTTVRRFSLVELDRLKNMDVSNYFIIKYKEFAFHENYYYLATELHEFTLPEYIQQMCQERQVGHVPPGEKIRQVRMVFQLLRGLSSLHQQYLMVHGELRPDNILLDVEGNVKVAGYGISRNTERDAPWMQYSDEDRCWLAPEQLVQKQKVSFKSDIFVAGMLIYYIMKCGLNPFGYEISEIIHNIRALNYVMDPRIDEEIRDLLKTMLSINRTERPCISDALRHPLFWADEKRLRFISIVGSDIVWELRQGIADGGKRDSMIDIIGTTPCSPKFFNWMESIEPHLLRDMSKSRQYKNNLVELTLFIHNYCTHSDKLSEKSRRVVDEPCAYFLNKFQLLFMTIYRAIKRSVKKDKSCYKPFF